MLLNNVTPQLPISMPSSAAPNYSRQHPQLRVFTGPRSPLYHPVPRLHSQLEVVRTAPLLFNHPPPRRAVSENVNALLASAATPAPSLPPRSRPGHKRKISEKLKSIFLPRQTSEPVAEPPLPLSSAPCNHPPRTSSMHHRYESVPDTRVAKWVKQQTTESTQSPPRPRRSPDTASFIVSSLATEFTFPRYHSHPDAQSTPALHADTKEMFSPLDEDSLLEPITAALYPKVYSVPPNSALDSEQIQMGDHLVCLDSMILDHQLIALRGRAGVRQKRQRCRRIISVISRIGM